MSRMAEAYMGAAKKARGKGACPHCGSGSEEGGVDSVEKMPGKETETSQMKMDDYQRRKALYTRALGRR